MWRKWVNFHKHISCKLLGQFISYLVCMVAYKEGIKYVNLKEIDPVVIEIRGVENSKLAVPVITHLCATQLSWPLTHGRVSWNNTLVCHTAFLAGDTQPCVVMCMSCTHKSSFVTSHAGLWPVHTQFLKVAFVCDIGMHASVRVYVCVSEWVCGYMHGCVGECMCAYVCTCCWGN